MDIVLFGACAFAPSSAFASSVPICDEPTTGSPACQATTYFGDDFTQWKNPELSSLRSARLPRSIPLLPGQAIVAGDTDESAALDKALLVDAFFRATAAWPRLLDGLVLPGVGRSRMPPSGAGSALGSGDVQIGVVPRTFQSNAVGHARTAGAGLPGGSGGSSGVGTGSRAARAIAVGAQPSLSLASPPDAGSLQQQDTRQQDGAAGTIVEGLQTDTGSSAAGGPGGGQSDAAATAGTSDASPGGDRPSGDREASAGADPAPPPGAFSVLIAPMDGTLGTGDIGTDAADLLDPRSLVVRRIDPSLDGAPAASPFASVLSPETAAGGPSAAADAVPVPEPPTLALVGVGVLLVSGGAYRLGRRRRSEVRHSRER
ncbi:MAG: hypothetical protein ABUS56_00490 [Acidobacteriota bacterium]